MYIRTKNRIYKVESILRDSGFVKGYNVGEMAFIRKDQVINQSETIEELCDDFVIEWLPTNHKDIFTIDKYSKEVVKSCIGNNKTKVYGAIWTSKGLIYVAKMNDNGELELI